MAFNNKDISDSQEIVETFAKHFSSSFSTSTKASSSSQISYQNSFLVKDISEDEIFIALSKLKPGLTTGPDLIPSFLVADCKNMWLQPFNDNF